MTADNLASDRHAAREQAKETAPAPARKRKSPVAPYVFLSPYYLLTAIFFFYPLVAAIILAFYQTNGPRSRAFVGLLNFKFLLADPAFHQALANTATFAFWAIALQLPLALGLALLVDSIRDRHKAWFRLILFSPNLAGGVFVGKLFSVLFAPRLGLINQTLQATTGWGLEQAWLQDPRFVMPAIVIAALWTGLGSAMVYFIAALQSVDQELVAAARIDGASRFEVFRHVTLPAIRPVSIILVVMTLIGAFQIFDLPLMLLYDGHGPNNSGYMIISYLNEVAFRQGDLGLGSAVGWVLAAIVALLTLGQLRLTRGLQDS